MEDAFYLGQGSSLLVISLILLNLILSEDSRDLLNGRVQMGYMLSFLVSISLIFTWLGGVYYFMSPSSTGKLLMEFASSLFWLVLMVSGLYIIKFLAIDNNVMPFISEKFFSVVFYFTISWLITLHLPAISYKLLAILSTAASIAGIYLNFILGKYYRFKEFFIIPLDLHTFYLSVALASVSLSLLLLARVYSYKSYLFYAIVIYLIIIYGIATLFRELRTLISKI